MGSLRQSDIWEDNGDGTHSQRVKVTSVPQLPAALAANGGIKVEGIVGGVAQPVSATQLPTALAAGGGMKVEGVTAGEPLPARGTAFRSASNQLTRPDNATQYTAGDVVVGLLTFAGIGRANGAGAWVLNPRLVSSVAPASTGSFKLWLFSAAPTVAAENAAFAPTDAEMLTNINIIYFDRADKTSNNTLYTQSNFVPIYLKCGAATTSVYGVLTDANGYTPASTETFDVILTGTQD